MSYFLTLLMVAVFTLNLSSLTPSVLLMSFFSFADSFTSDGVVLDPLSLDELELDPTDSDPVELLPDCRLLDSLPDEDKLLLTISLEESEYRESDWLSELLDEESDPTLSKLNSLSF